MNLAKIFTSILLFSFTSSFPQLWTNLAGGYNSLNSISGINDIVASGNQIYASGMYADANNKNYVNRWNGSTWNNAGSSFSTSAFDYVYKLCADPFGNVYAGGAFYTNSGTPQVAKWNGTVWTNLGVIPGTGSQGMYKIWALCSDNNGNIYAAGSFTTANTSCVVCKWNGTNWTSLGAPLAVGNSIKEIYALCSDAIGNVYAAGSFKNADGNRYVAKWNGTSWTELGSGPSALSANERIYSLACDKNGNVYAGGDFSNENGNPYVAKWNGSNWTELTGNQPLNASGTIHSIVCDAGGNVFCAGNFQDPFENRYVAKWNGSDWSELGNLNASGRIASLCLDATGNIYAAGDFADGSNNYYVARFGPVSTGLRETADLQLSESEIFPNPSDGRFYVRKPDTWSIRVYNVLGGYIQHTERSIDPSTSEIALEDNASGIYFVQVFNSEGSLVQTTKLLIRK